MVYGGAMLQFDRRPRASRDPRLDRRMKTLGPRVREDDSIDAAASPSPIGLFEIFN